MYVLATAAKQKNKINQGQRMWLFERFRAAAPIATGTIQSARVSFTVVPTTSATGPYRAVAPTTELVSWMARAAHNPNCVCVKCRNQPSGGKIRSAMEFKIKMVPSEIAISSSLASMMGPTAAMALPPQIAVPVEIRIDAVLFTRKRRPSRSPKISAKEMLAAV